MNYNLDVSKDYEHSHEFLFITVSSIFDVDKKIKLTLLSVLTVRFFQTRINPIS